jgi:glycosyltransferase involved in cell wall biosynthesis
LKILQVGSALYDWGGIERYIDYLTQGLTDRGHEVTVLCPKGSPLDEHVPTRKLYCGLRKQHEFSKFPELMKIFQQERWDVVNIHYSRDYLLPALAAKFTKQPFLMMTRHVVLPWRWIKIKEYMTYFDHILGVSEAVKEKLLSMGVPEDFVSTAYAGVPPLEPTATPAESRYALGLREDQFVVGYFGRLVPEKGVDTLVRAAAKLPKNVRVEIFGDGFARADLEALSLKLLNTNVTFRGMIPDVRNAMSAMDVIAMPSFWDEAFPYAVLEANSLSKPVIATRTGGLPEMILDGHTGLLFDRNDSDRLAELITDLAEHPDRVEEMGFAARERQRELFTVPKMAERIEAVYETARSLARDKNRTLQQKTL